MPGTKEASLPNPVPSVPMGIAAAATAATNQSSRARDGFRRRSVKPCGARSMKQGMTFTVPVVDRHDTQFFQGRDASHSFHALAAARHSGKS